jgi:hypothetical protein
VGYVSLVLLAGCCESLWLGEDGSPDRDGSDLCRYYTKAYHSAAGYKHTTGLQQPQSAGEHKQEITDGLRRGRDEYVVMR